MKRSHGARRCYPRFGEAGRSSTQSRSCGTRIDTTSALQVFPVEILIVDPVDRILGRVAQALRELKKIKTAWPELNYFTPKGVLQLYPSKPAITPARPAPPSGAVASQKPQEATNTGRGTLSHRPNRGVPSEGFWPKGSLPAQGRLPILGLLG